MVDTMQLASREIVNYNIDELLQEAKKWMGLGRTAGVNLVLVIGRLWEIWDDDHGRFDEGVVMCKDVEIKIDDSYFKCNVDIYFEKNTDYENGRIRNCVKKPLF